MSSVNAQSNKIVQNEIVEKKPRRRELFMTDEELSRFKELRAMKLAPILNEVTGGDKMLNYLFGEMEIAELEELETKLEKKQAEIDEEMSEIAERRAERRYAELLIDEKLQEELKDIKLKSKAKPKKVKPAKAPKNPFPKEIRISDGIWKKNPKWVNWEKENK
jgi:DNA-binding protein H-NS